MDQNISTEYSKQTLENVLRHKTDHTLKQKTNFTKLKN